MSELFYTYIWRDAAGTPFYVGKGKGKRATVVHNRSPEFKEIHSLGGCSVEIVDEFVLESQAHAHEIELIELHGRRVDGGTLVNKTWGGEGASGTRHSAETRRRQSVSRSKYLQDPAARVALSESLKGREVGESARANMSAAQTARFKRPDERERLSVLKIGRPLSPEHRSKLSVAHRERYNDPLERAKTGAHSKGRTASGPTKAILCAVQRMRGPRSDNTSGFKGVTFHRSSRKWIAKISVDGVEKHLGSYPSAENAALAYDGAAREAWRGACYLNFPTLDAVNGALS